MKRFAWLIISMLVVCMPAFAAQIHGPGLHETPLMLDDPSIEVGTVGIYNSTDLTVEEGDSKHVLVVDVTMNEEHGWKIDELHLYLQPYYDKGFNVVAELDVPGDDKKGIKLSKFPHKGEFDGTGRIETLIVPFTRLFDGVDGIEDADGNPMEELKWGNPYSHMRTVSVVLHADLIRVVDDVEQNGDAWGGGDVSVPHTANGTSFVYEIAHNQMFHFIDSPVDGLGVLSPTFNGKTVLGGKWPGFPGERAEFSVGDYPFGDALSDHKVSPLDIFEQADTDDVRVINLARLLQSLDADMDPKKGITITPDIDECVNDAMAALVLGSFDFSDVAQIESIIQATIDQCAAKGVALASVSAEDAKANLDRSLDTTMFRKNVSRSPELTSSKSKLNIMGMWFPALKANGEPATFLDGETLVEGVPYFDENGDLIRVADKAKPVVVVYTDGVEETGYEDTFAGISRDDGNTFKRKNLSRAADKSSFTLADGTEYYGQVKKPVFHVKGNKILVAWTSKFCKGGRPAYAIKLCDDPLTPEVETPETGCAEYCTGKEEDGTLQCEADYPHDDPYYVEDIWGVGGPQRSVDYTDQGFPEVGEVPYSCVWTARGTVVSQSMLNSSNGINYWANNGYVVGDIVWFKPERLTSGRRDANQAFMGGGSGAGFAIAWQEDPEGLRPGDAAGPGPGWGGATTNHKTDIWYSYITWDDFGKVDMNFEPGGDPQHDDPELVGRPKALVPMSLPVRLTDNEVVNTDNLMVELDGDGYPITGSDGDWIPVINPDTDGEGTGTHAYGYKVEGLCEDFYEFINPQEALKRVCITADGRLLDGDTGASRPNLFLQPYTKPDGTKSAWAIMAYEETKGVGGGAPDHEPGGGPYGDEPVVDEGKNAIYHSFDFTNPDLVSAGTILNLPERDPVTNALVYLREVSLDAEGNVVYGDLVLDYLGQPQLAYENARRPRFILQSKSAMGSSKTVLLILYKEGEEGHGRPSDIMMRRVAATSSGNPYKTSHIICNEWTTADNGQDVCVDGAMNMSSVTPVITTDSMGDPTADDPYGAVKVVTWLQDDENFADQSFINPYDDARAHRGQIRGDFVVMGYSYTPNWAAARNGNDKYDFFVRRSFDGGQTWTTKPAAEGGAGVEHCQLFKTVDENGMLNQQSPAEELCTYYAAGDFEQARNLSQLKNAKESVIEPRVVAVPGTIKDPATGKWTGISEDKQNPNVFYVSYGLSTNPKKDPVTGEQDMPAPTDLFYSFSQDKGENYVEVTWIVNPDSDGNYAGEEVTRWDFLAKGDPEQGEAQLRMTPDGSRFYATWLAEGEEGSDIWFRRIMSPTFPANVATTP